MAILIAAVALVGVLCLLDLLLTFGVIRRLREHTALLAGPRDLSPVVGLGAGERPGVFSAVTASGEVVTGTARLRVVGFFSSSCAACPERVPSFVEYLRRHRVERENALAVIQGSHGAPSYLDQIAEVALVCVEPADGEVGRAFKVTGFPAFCLLDTDGTVAVSGYDPSVLPVPATV
jgi:hypothetical protein